VSDSEVLPMPELGYADHLRLNGIVRGSRLPDLNMRARKKRERENGPQFIVAD
jgi:hypothetical protein